jgi:hypothetical protein
MLPLRRGMRLTEQVLHHPSHIVPFFPFGVDTARGVHDRPDLVRRLPRRGLLRGEPELHACHGAGALCGASRDAARGERL